MAAFITDAEERGVILATLHWSGSFAVTTSHPTGPLRGGRWVAVQQRDRIADAGLYILHLSAQYLLERFDRGAPRRSRRFLLCHAQGGRMHYRASPSMLMPPEPKAIT